MENFFNCLKQFTSTIGDTFDEEYVRKMNVLELAGLEPIVRNLYSLKQQEAKVAQEYFLKTILFLFNQIFILILVK